YPPITMIYTLSLHDALPIFNLTPYKLFFPEKRQFFLENAGVFDFSIGGDNDLLFFSRQIGIDPVTGEEVPVNGGAKITGSLGKRSEEHTSELQSRRDLVCRL